jgi:hypothetical protein
MPPAPPLPPDTFAFGVFGDGPYYSVQYGRFSMVIDDVNRTRPEWLLHVGDIFGDPCTDETYADRLAALNTIAGPVIYTPGDNEWVDCQRERGGNYEPLERLQHLRSLFFASPGRTLGARPMQVESQAADPRYAEFVENVRWRRGGFLFVTMHMTGAGNGTADFDGRTNADAEEARRRSEAALAWLEQAFLIARADGLRGVVLAVHGNPGLERDPAAFAGFEEFVDRLEYLVESFAGQVLLIHGDTHTYRVDQPLTDAETGRVLPNFTRLETFGSPHVGWTRVVIDSVAGRIVRFEPRKTPDWRYW